MGFDATYLPTVNINTSGGIGGMVNVIALLGHGSPMTSLQSGVGVLGKILSISIVDGGIGYASAPNINLTGYGDGSAQAYANIITGYYTYPGRYEDDTGFLSSYNFLQDKDYYQSFSYVIKVEESISKYAKVVRDLVHPAGFKMWGKYMYGGVDPSNIRISGTSSNISTNT